MAQWSRSGLFDCFVLYYIVGVVSGFRFQVAGLTKLSNSLLCRRFLICGMTEQGQEQEQVQLQGQLFSLRSNVSLLE